MWISGFTDFVKVKFRGRWWLHFAVKEDRGEALWEAIATVVAACLLPAEAMAWQRRGGKRPSLCRRRRQEWCRLFTSLSLRYIAAPVLHIVDHVEIEMFVLGYGLYKTLSRFFSSHKPFWFAEVVCPTGSSLSSGDRSLTPLNPALPLTGTINCWTSFCHVLVPIAFIRQCPRCAPELALLLQHLIRCMKDDVICGLFPVQYFWLYWIVLGSPGG